MSRIKRKRLLFVTFGMRRSDGEILMRVSRRGRDAARRLLPSDCRLLREFEAMVPSVHEVDAHQSMVEAALDYTPHNDATNGIRNNPVVPNPPLDICHQ